MCRDIGKSISKNLSSKYSQKALDHSKLSATDALKTTWKRVIQKTAEATGDFIGKKFADKITSVSKISLKDNLETNEEEKILRKGYISPEKGRKLLMI